MNPSYDRLSTRAWMIGWCLFSLLGSAPIAAPSTEPDTVDMLMDGLPFPDALTVSPDGAHVYAGSGFVAVLGVFERDVGSGNLTFVEAESELDGSPDPADPVSLAISPDGKHIYLSLIDESAVAVFARDLGTGETSFVEVEVDGAGGVSGLAGGFAIAVSPDGAHVYVGTTEDTVVVFARDAGTGEISFVEAHGVPSEIDAGPRGIAVSPDGAHVYVVGQTTDSVTVLGRDAGTGELTFVETKVDGVGGVDGIRGAVAVAVSPDDAHVYVFGRLDAAVAAFDRDAGTGALTFVEAEFDGVGGVTGMNSPLVGLVSPDGGHVYVGTSFDDAIVVFDRDALTGELDFVEAEPDRPLFSSAPVDIALSPDGAHMYSVSGNVFDRDAGTGELTEVHVSLEQIQQATVSPDGAHLYAVSAPRDALFGFSRDPGTGSLTQVDTLVDGVGGVDGLDQASGATVSPDGAHVYVAAGGDDAVSVFARDAGTGVLTFVEAEFDGVGGNDGLDGASDVTVSPDGDHLYVSGLSDDAVAVFARDAGSGQLTFVEAELDGIAGVDGLSGAIDAVVSPDGAHVYVAAFFDDAVAAFERDAVTGELTFVEAEFGIDFARSVALSADGAHVYVGGDEDSFIEEGYGALYAYSRNAATGELTLIETEVNGLSGVRWIHPTSVVVSPDGTHVHATSFADGAVAAFRRDATTGRISYIESERRGSDGFPALGNVLSIAASPAGDHLYAAGGHGAIAVLAPDFSCSPTPEPGCRVGPKGKLTYRSHPIDLKERLTWTYLDGPATTLEEFDPGTDNHFAVCIYDGSGTLVLDALAPAVGDCRSDSASTEKPCWTASTNSASYKDPFRTPDGLGSILLKPGGAGKTTIKAKGLGTDLPTMPLPLGLPVRVQLQSGSELCWETLFPAATKNDGSSFKAKVP